MEGENLVPSFILAGQHKYKYLETDIYESKDGKFYCINNNKTVACSNDNIAFTKSLSQDIEKIKLNKIIKKRELKSRVSTQSLQRFFFGDIFRNL